MITRICLLPQKGIPSGRGCATIRCLTVFQWLRPREIVGLRWDHARWVPMVIWMIYGWAQTPHRPAIPA